VTYFISRVLGAFVLFALISPQTAFANEKCPGKMPLLPVILGFHDTVETAAHRSLDWDYTLAELRNHIQTFKREGYTFLSLEDISQYIKESKPFPEKSVSFTFDDGYSGNIQAFKVFEEEKVPANFFIISGLVGTKIENKRYVTWDELKTAAKSLQFVWFNSHTKSHPDLRTLQDGNVLLEFQNSDETLRAHLGRRYQSILAYPYGHYDSKVAEIASTMFEQAYTYGPNPLGGVDRDDSIPWCWQIPRLSVDLPIFRESQKLLSQVETFKQQLQALQLSRSRAPASVAENQRRYFNERRDPASVFYMPTLPNLKADRNP
jgi:peptidoglycan/xylan/chitin deacetylase (PgdA/CDA1 family)